MLNQVKKKYQWHYGMIKIKKKCSSDERTLTSTVLK